MTKFILVGGYPDRAPDGGAAFVRATVDGFDQPVRILECLFARPKETWDEAFEKEKFFFAKHLSGLKVIFTLAEQERFIEQIRHTDILVLRGGAAETLLIELLKQHENLLRELDGKTVVGSSAGADALATEYYGLDTLTLEKGLGFVPVKVLVHYRSNYNTPNIDWNKAYHALESSDSPLPVLTLTEGEFKVFET